VCTNIIAKKLKMVGTDADPIQIDESRFAGGRKYNRGCILNDDASPLSEDNDAEVEKISATTAPV